jgi:uncharacterized protein
MRQKMQVFAMRAALFLGLSSFGSLASTNPIPTFTPNVVDAAGRLTSTEVREINDALQLIRDKAGILGAVFIVQELKDESIESLAERAFNTWKLGSVNQDNGLLLVLAMADRRSRFEVGYGLEGDLTDALTRRVLDDVLRPHMRKGDIKTAIVDSFLFLARAKSKDPALLGTDDETSVEDLTEPRSAMNRTLGFLGWAIFLFCLWLVRPLAVWRAIVQARCLARVHPEFGILKDKSLNQGQLKLRHLLLGRDLVFPLFLRCFFSINPGVFVFIVSAVSPFGFAGVAALFTFISVVYYRSLNGKYRSAEAYQAYLKKVRDRNKKYVDKGYMKETAPGVFAFTDAYYSSSEYRSSSFGSRGSSRSSSSSGGGRSGGGGSSSSW